jgi:hypothetical protein
MNPRKREKKNGGRKDFFSMMWDDIKSAFAKIG